MMRRLALLLMMVGGLLTTAAVAREVAGVEVPEQVQLAGVEQPLLLNGAGVRKKFFINVYVGALYLADRQRDPQVLLASPPANRVLMHFVYHKVSRRNLEEGWRDGFAANLDADALAALAERLNAFNAMFGDMREGDQVWLDYVPGQGTTVHVNERAVGVVPGEDFNAALLSVWLGRQPVSEALKNALVGDDTD